jgi:hypothetical protein
MARHTAAKVLQEVAIRNDRKTLRLPNGTKKLAEDICWDDFTPEELRQDQKLTANINWELWLRLKAMANSQHTDRSGAVKILIRDHAASYTRDVLEQAQGVEPMPIPVAPLYRRALALTALKLGTTPEALVNRMIGEHLAEYIQLGEAQQQEVQRLETLLQETTASSTTPG